MTKLFGDSFSKAVDDKEQGREEVFMMKTKHISFSYNEIKVP